MFRIARIAMVFLKKADMIKRDEFALQFV